MKKGKFYTNLAKYEHSLLPQQLARRTTKYMKGGGGDHLVKMY